MNVVKTYFGSIVERFQGRADSEHEQAILRCLLTLLVFIYFISVATWLSIHNILTSYIIIAAYLAISVVYVLWIALAPAKCPRRRLLAMGTDFAAMSLLMYCGGELAAPIYPLYLWAILGNGFRFGLRYLLAAGAMGVVGFGAVVLCAEPWRDHLLLSLGLLAGLVAVPAHVATLIGKLTEAKAQAESASQAKSRFLAAASHDLRQPFQAMNLYIEILEALDLDAKIQTVVDLLRHSMVAGEELLQALLDISTFDAGIVSPKVTVFPLADLIEELAYEHLCLMGERGLRFRRFVVNALVETDRVLAKRMLRNLLLNAVRYTQQGGILHRLPPARQPHARPGLRHRTGHSGGQIAGDL